MKAGNVRLVTVIIFLSQACCKPPEKISSRDDTDIGQADTSPANAPSDSFVDEFARVSETTSFHDQNFQQDENNAHHRVCFRGIILRNRSCCTRTNQPHQRRTQRRHPEEPGWRGGPSVQIAKGNAARRHQKQTPCDKSETSYHTSGRCSGRSTQRCGYADDGAAGWKEQKRPLKKLENFSAGVIRRAGIGTLSPQTHIL